jgi:hypothetical protein
VGLTTTADSIRLQTGDAVCVFTKRGAGWAFESAEVRGVKTALPLTRADSFFTGSGEASQYRVVADTATRKEILFSGPDFNVTYRVDASEHLPRFFIELDGPATPECFWRTAGASPDQRGAWVTRGETASDREGRDVFIDGSGRLVFGHSKAGAVDAAYVIQAELLDNINPRNKTMQVSDTFFGSLRQQDAGGYFGVWRLRFGAAQPKRFGIVFDRDLGGRIHDVCEKYYADAVDSQVQVTAVPPEFDPQLAVERLPVRLSCPESLVPGYGWHMEEYFPGYGHAEYPYGDECGIETGALLAYQGHATGRDWEKNFGKYVVHQMPLWGESDGKGYFTKRPGGWTRWAYHCDYAHPFPLMEGGNWTASEQLYWVAKLFGDEELKRRSMDLMRHDIFVKLDLANMTFPPCWNPVTGKLGDHRDDWNTTACLGYCAEICTEILYPETKDPQFLTIADRITDWLQSIWGPETRMNYLHPKVNTFHCWMGWLVRAMVHRYERTDRAEFLDTARDLAWVIILTLGTTEHRDHAGRSFTGVTCVGVRGCVDYDCAPNLCQEKDQAFLQNIGPLMNHVSGPGYAKYIALQKHVLPRDSWVAAFRIQEQHDLNLRTNYDNYVRAMTNLAFAINRSSDPEVCALEKSVSNFDTGIDSKRDIVLANGTVADRRSLIQPAYLKPGNYTVTLDGRPLGEKTAEQLLAGIEIQVPANSTRALKIAPVALAPPQTPPARNYDATETWLNSLQEMAAQRGIGLPRHTYQRNISFRGGPLSLSGTTYEHGLGLAANSVVIYRLDGRYKRFAALLGIADDAQGPDGPKPSAIVTLFLDGKCLYASGAVRPGEPIRNIDLDVRNAQVLTIRVSSNFDDNGDYRNDMVNLADARLIGKA